MACRARGFPLAALLVGAIALLTVWTLADRVLARTPQSMQLHPDGDATHGQVMEKKEKKGDAHLFVGRKGENGVRPLFLSRAY